MSEANGDDMANDIQVAYWAGHAGEDEYKEGHVAQRIPRECESWVIEGVKR